MHQFSLSQSILATVVNSDQIASPLTDSQLNQPLSREDLLNLSALIDSSIKSTKSSIVNTLKENEAEFLEEFKRILDLQSQVGSLKLQLGEIHQQFYGEGTGIKDTLISRVNERNMYVEKKLDLELKMRALHVLQEIHSLQEEYSVNIEKGRYCACVDILNCAEERISQLSSQNSQLQILKALKDQWKVHKTELTTQLEESLKSSWCFNSNDVSTSFEIHLSISPIMRSRKSVHISEIFSAALLLSYTKQLLQPVAKILKTSFLPLMFPKESTRSIIPTYNLSTSKFHDKLLLQLQIVESVSVENVFQNIETLFQFLEYLFRAANSAEHVKSKSPQSSPSSSPRSTRSHTLSSPLPSFSHYMSTFGQTLWSHVSSSIISSILHPNIPSSVSEFSKFNKLSQLSEQLEIRVKGMGVFSPPSQGETNHDLGKELSLYAGDVDMHFSIQKRTQLSVMAREVIIDGTWDTITVDEAMKQSALSYFNSSENEIQEKSNDLDGAKQLLKLKLFEYPKCAISKRISNYQLFLTKSISEIVELNHFCATQLYFTTRDLIDLFRTSIHVLYGKQISTVPQLAMLHHNDLLWLSHFIMGMGYRLKANGDLNFQYDDLVGILRREAEEVARRTLVRQRSILFESIKSTELCIHDLSSIENLKELENSYKQISHHLRHLSTIWKPVLPSHLSLSFLGHLFDSVLRFYITEVLSMDDIPADESSKLVQTLSMLLPLSSLFTSSTPLSSSSASPPSLPFSVSDEELQAITLHVPSFSKFFYITLILDASLVAIMEYFRSGKLIEAGFRKKEVTRMIKALFMDSDLRRRSLDEIEGYM